jgi:hypothetical protein
MLYKILGLLLMWPFFIFSIGYPEYIHGKGKIWRWLFKFNTRLVLSVIFGCAFVGLFVFINN